MIKTIHNTRYEDLIRWLRDAREGAGLTTRELAARLDEPFQFVSKVELGQRKLNVYEYVQYCEALGVDPGVGLTHLAKKSPPWHRQTITGTPPN
ncbi:helix-turn-helix domain-containing protein [Marinobacterium rhizophilum]|uniref:Helix-turn-helix transcriptional regulator n=1 Tax=Marinobacterium rhizophilum TaxID=420402 RepID=A0ABY5HGL3_9GAMM|nr:helix-turn-helix transcriptional regulator [Marinobacterium rhizophilum]UTW11425.1 helix-turn-helix transcriptional regulator [Marinobacterium rhizophilum]